MKTDHAKAKKKNKRQPFGTVKVGNVSVPIHRQTNIIPQRDPAGKIIYGAPDASGKRRALIKYQSDIYTLAYYEGSKRVRQKFSDLEKAKREAELAPSKLETANSKHSNSRGMTGPTTFTRCRNFGAGSQTPISISQSVTMLPPSNACRRTPA
jgi:hypothetical protein